MKIKQSKITAANVDDYIRKQKRAGKKVLYWEDMAGAYFKDFVCAVNAGNNLAPPNRFFGGFRFMGVKHYLKN